MKHTVELGDLGPLGAQLGTGGQAEVFAVGGDGTLAFKRYHEGQRLDPSAVDRLIDLFAALPPDRQALVKERSAWPVARVMHQRRMVGVLMPRIVPAFMTTVSTSHASVEHPRELQYLLRPDACHRLGIPHPDFDDRWRLVGLLAEFMAAVEGYGVILGDLSDKNILWAAGGVLVIDCDSFRIDGYRGIATGLETPGWEDPSLVGDDPDVPSDRYKLCLVVHRALALAPTGVPTADEVMVAHEPSSPILAALLVRGITGPRDGRPLAAEVAAALTGMRGRPTITLGAAPATPSPTAPAAGGRPRIQVAVGTPASPPAAPVPPPPAPVGRPRVAVPTPAAPAPRPRTPIPTRSSRPDRVGDAVLVLFVLAFIALLTLHGLGRI